MLSCLSFVSQEKYGTGEKKIKKPKCFSLSAEHFLAVAGNGLCVQGAGRGLHGPCALGGFLGAGEDTWRFLPVLACHKPPAAGFVSLLWAEQSWGGSQGALPGGGCV